MVDTTAALALLGTMKEYVMEMEKGVLLAATVEAGAVRLRLTAVYQAEERCSIHGHGLDCKTLGWPS